MRTLVWASSRKVRRAFSLSPMRVSSTSATPVPRPGRTNGPAGLFVVPPAAQPLGGDAGAPSRTPERSDVRTVQTAARREDADAVVLLLSRWGIIPVFGGVRAVRAEVHEVAAGSEPNRPV